jgi:hypothetical protein
VEGGAVFDLEAVGKHALEHAHALEDLHARGDEGLAHAEAREALALDHGHAEPALGKKGGGRASRGAAADHDDVDVGAGGHGIGECALIRSKNHGSHSTAWRASGASAKQQAVP